MDKIIEILGFISFAWVLTQWAELIAERKPKLIRFICWKCWAFWLAFISKLDLNNLLDINPLLFASTIALIAYLIDRRI